jgi:hypothetical protein
MFTWNQTKFLNQAQRFLNLKKSVQPELHDFKMGRPGFKEEPSKKKINQTQNQGSTLVSTYLFAVLVTDLPSLRGSIKNNEAIWCSCPLQ